MSAAPAPAPVPARAVPAASPSRSSRALLAAFGLAAAVDLISLLAAAELGHQLAKPLLMPLLAAYAVTRGAPRLLTAALLFGWGGDVFLLSDADWAFLVGMGSFAAGHVCYLVLFGRRRTSVPLAAAYTAALVGTVALLWPDLPAELRIPVAGYSLLLTAMAYRASSLGLLAGLGGGLFLLSDTLIATGVAEWPQLPAPDFWVMLTYIGAQYLLTTGALRSMYGERRTTV
ncbi:lysoplasmalogenase [Streptomyces lateritius]|uniref:lysoplasmalogenase n=1 Tax=Streptomyces TaxID=1883 RepID=UPI0009A11CB7|nr:lysoplasmalogenase [Streptomyces lateritius]